MFLIFKKRSATTKPHNHSVQDKFAEMLASYCFVMQSRLATYLQAKTERLSRGTKKASLLVFCLTGGVYSMYVLIFSFKVQSTLLSPVGSLQLPIYSSSRENIYIHGAADINEGALQRIQTFKTYMDSLLLSSSGKTLHDSILKGRPGLMDSIKAINKIYYQNLKK